MNPEPESRSQQPIILGRRREHRAIDPERDLGKAFIAYINQRVPDKKRAWALDMRVVASVDGYGEQHIAMISIAPENDGYKLQYFNAEGGIVDEHKYEEKPVWSVNLGSDRNFSKFDGITPEEFFMEMELLVDPNSTSTDPRLKTTKIIDGEEVVPEGVHIRSYILSYLDEPIEKVD